MVHNVKTVMILMVVTALLTSAALAAEDDTVVTGWRKSLTVDLTTTQTSYSDSWVGGEAGSVNWVGNLNGTAEKQLTEWLDLKSTLKLSFGQTLTQDEETKDWSKPKKSTDLIDWETVGLLTLHKFVDPYAAFRLESQFFDGGHPNKKLYFSPLKLTESAGIARKFYKKKENDVVISRLGLALRQIIQTGIVDSSEVSAGAWDYVTESATTTDGGLESVTDVVLTLDEKLLYVGKLSLYKALYFSDKDKVEGTPFEDDWKAIDINWENLITASITKIVSVILYTQFLYDKQVSKKGRFKETLGIGFVFKMI
jgi:hypothetical protein